MRLATLLAIFTLLVWSLAAPATAGPQGAAALPDAACAAPAAMPSACAASATKAAWQGRLDRIVRGEGTVVYDRCPPNSDKFCPAGTSCCQNAAGEYRCCK